MLRLSQQLNTGACWRVLYLFVGVYGLLFALYFLADPLGQVPVLDARENLAWADRIAADALPAEPIYRALLYPWLLAWLPSGALPLAATVLGLFLHGASALLVGLIAGRLWKDPIAARIAGLIYGVYPVALYFAGQVLDITLATTLFLAAVYALLICGDCASRRRALLWGLFAGFLGGLAVLARPNFLPPVLCFPLAVLFFRARHPLGQALGLAVGLAFALGIQGAVNYKLSGEVRVLPWQGAFNLYAANRADANGKYYTQGVYFERTEAGTNTTRMESEWLYRQAVGDAAPQTVSAMNAYWREQLIREIAADPGRWLGLMVRKLVYAANNWEQYNNLTYAYHKERWPYLRWNPLGWGLLLIGAACGLVLGFRRVNRPALYALGLVALAYLGGLLLFFVSARFRLPLAPLLCVALGGCVFFRQAADGRKKYLLGLGVLGIGVISFGNWFGAQDRQSFIQDELLLAVASSQVGADAEALRLARSVLERDPNRPEARRLEVTSRFNLWLASGETADWQSMVGALSDVSSSDAAVEFIRGYVHWRAGQPEEAVRTWQSAVERYEAEAGSSAAALRLVGGDGLPADEPIGRLLGL
jgi:hypothetical protein